MNKKVEKKKGFTIVELVIVLAVLVIAAGMVVTFSSMMHGAQGVSNARYEALQDVRVAESLIESFIENNVGAASDVGLIENRSLSFTHKNDAEKTAKISFHYSNFVKIITVKGYDTEPVTMQFEHIKDITFMMVEATTDTLYYCTITYDVGGTDFNYTFCVNPYVGE